MLKFQVFWPKSPVKQNKKPLDKANNNCYQLRRQQNLALLQKGKKKLASPLKTWSFWNLTIYH